MAEVIHVFESQILLNDVPYTVQVVGRPAGNIWEGWLEFISKDGGDVRRTRRETTQPNRTALEYWATGLSRTYLEGALVRTIEPPAPPIVGAVSQPYFREPAPSPEPVAVEVETAVLDPFSVGAKGEDLLRRELNALADWHLHNIVRAYDLADESLNVEALTHPELVELIVAAVEPV